MNQNELSPPSSAPDALMPHQNPIYVDRHAISKLLQPHLVLLSLQDSRILHQPIILTATCYQSINQIIDQIILSILHAISAPHIDLPLEPHHLQSNGIRQVLSGSLAQQSIQAAELAWTVYQNKRVQHPPPLSRPHPPHQPGHSISPSDLFLQLQIDCQILSPYASQHHTWLKPAAQQTNHPHSHHPNPRQNYLDEHQPSHPEPINVFNQSLDLLLDPNRFHLQLQGYHQLFNTVNLSLRQQHPDPTQTVLQHRVTIYFLGFIQAFTNYLLKAILSIVETRLPYPSAIQAHQLVGFIAQDNQIVNFWNILQVIQSKSSLALHLPHSPLSSPYQSLEPHEDLPKKKSLTLKPLLLTPRTTNNKLGPSFSPLNQLPATYASTSSLPTGNSFDLTHLPASTPPFVYSHHKQLTHLTPNPVHASLDLPFHSAPPDQSFVRGSFTSPNSPSSPMSGGPHYIMYSGSSYLPRSAPMPHPHPVHAATQSNPSIHTTYQNQLIPRPRPATDNVPVRPNRYTFGQAPSSTPLAGSEPHDVLQPSSRCHDDSRANLEVIHSNSDSSQPLSPSLSTPARSPLSCSATSSNPSLRSPHLRPLHNSSGGSPPQTTSETSRSFDPPLPRPRPRSRSWTTMLSPQANSSLPSSSPNAFPNLHLQQQPNKPKSLKQGHSGGSNTRISFEQLMKTNETVKFSLTPSPCLDGSPMSPHSSQSSDSLVVSPRALADPIAIQPGTRLPPNQLVPRFELRPRVRKESADTLELSRAGHQQEQFSSPSSNITSSSSLDSHIDMSPALHPGSKKIPIKPVTNMSSMSQRIAAARTPDLNSSFQRRPHLESLSDILNSDPPWLNPKGNNTRNKPTRPDDMDFEGLTLTTPQSIQLDGWNPQQYAMSTSTTSISKGSTSGQSSLLMSGKPSLEPLISHRPNQVGRASDNDTAPNVNSRPQTGDAQSSGLQKTLRGFKSMISRRKKGKDDSQGSVGSSKSSYWKGTDWYTNSISSRNESFDQTKSLSALEQSPRSHHDPNTDDSIESRLKQSIKSNPPINLDSNSLQISCSEPMSTSSKTLESTFRMPSKTEPIGNLQKGMTEDLQDDFVDNKRSKLGRSMSMTSLIRRPGPHDAGRSGTPQTLKGAARSKKSPKSRTLTENSNSSGTSGGTVTHSRSRFNSSIGSLKMFKKTTQEETNRADLDEIMALATRLDRRFRGSGEHKRAQSFDSIQLPRPGDNERRPNPQLRTHERLETGSSMNSDYEISVAQELKPASINRIFLNSPQKSTHRYSYLKSDENMILNSYYDSSSQSTAIDEELPNMKESLQDDMTDNHMMKMNTRATTSSEENGGGDNMHINDDDNWISLDQLRIIVSKLNSKVDELLADNHYHHQLSRIDNSNYPSSNFPLGIKKAELLKIIMDQ